MSVLSKVVMSTSQRTSLMLAGLGAVAAVVLVVGSSDAPPPPENPIINSVDPDYSASHDTAALWGEVLQLQGACLDATLNRGDPQAPPCLELARRRAATEAPAVMPAAAGPQPGEVTPSGQSEGASQ